MKGNKKWLLLAAAGVLALSCSCCGLVFAVGLLNWESPEPQARVERDSSQSEADPAASGTPSEEANLPDSAPAAAPTELMPGQGATYADAMYNTIQPVIGENLSYEDGDVLFTRAIDAGHANPHWSLSVLGIEHDYETDLRTFWYDFADGSRITFTATETQYQDGGLELASVAITR